MRGARPINADVPVKAPRQEAARPRPELKPAPAPPPVRRRRRRQAAWAPKLIAALVLVAIGFIVLAIVGGSNGPQEEVAAVPGPAPSAAREGGSGSGDPQSAEALGFPGFATGNTTRVGGADPTANAAAVALAAFPSRTADQRPAAVTLVDEDDWAGGIAAAVLMAAPVRAPVLISAAGEAPAITAEAVAALAPRGDDSTAGAGAIAIGGVAAPVAGKVTRVAAGSAAAEAARIARLRDRLTGSAPAHIVLASAAQPAFAMPAAGWAARSGDPVLFAAADSLPAETAAYLQRHPGVPVYVLGPSSAISSEVVREAAAIGNAVKRVAGESPVANAIALARYRDGRFGWNVNDPGHGFVVARDEQPLDAAAAAPLSASGTWGPLLLTDDAATLPAELRSYFLDVKPGYTDNPTRAFYNHVWVIGDQEAIDVNQQAEANQLAELTRIGGES
ncbi:MAG: hypothetical protein R2725_07845 [Solirubrobacterales bacterium]